MDKNIKDNDLIVKLVCLILSFGLWMYVSNVENRVREYRIDGIPVEIINTEVLKEANLALIPNQKITVGLNLEGPSNEIYKVKKEQFKIVVNLGNYALKKGDNNIPIEILSYPGNINIRNDSFLRVNVLLDNYIEKILPITSKVKVTTEEGTYAEKTTLTPSNVKIMGAEEYVNKVKELVVEGEVNNISEETRMQLPIKAIDSNGNEVREVDLSVTRTDVTLSIKKGKEVPIKVVTEGKPTEGLILKSVIPERETVEVLGDKEVLDAISYIETEPVNLSQFTADGEVTVILKVPTKTTLAMDINQIKVKYTFSKIITKDFNIPITIVGTPEGYIAQLSANSIKVRVRALQENMSSAKPEDILCEVDLSGVPMEGGDITPKITISNSSLTLIESSPKTINVEFIKETASEQIIIPEEELDQSDES